MNINETPEEIVKEALDLARRGQAEISKALLMAAKLMLDYGWVEEEVVSERSARPLKIHNCYGSAIHVSSDSAGEVIYTVKTEDLL